MSGVLVDTSVWIDHFRNGNEALVNLLRQDLALTHPMVIGEIACGTPPAPRARTLGDLGLLAMVQHCGCGLVDLVLLTSTLITPGAKLWTLDKGLAELAERFGVAHRVAAH